MIADARIARLLGPRDLVFATEALPTHLDAGTYLGRTLRSAVSIGTERSAWAGEPPLRPGNTYPRLVGYCNLAEVQESNDERVKPGALVLTHQSHRNAFVARADDVLAFVPSGIDLNEASLVYLAFLGFSALRKASFSGGDSVAVIGAGPIGLAAIGLARALGAQVLAIAKGEERQELARRMGAVTVLSERSSIPEDRSDLIVLTASTWSAWQTALRLAAPWARISVIGFPGRTEGPPPFNPLDSRYFYDKQLAILAAGMPIGRGQRPTAEASVLREGMRYILSLIVDGKLSLAPLVSEVLHWSALESVYARAAAKDNSFVTAVLDWTRTS